MTNNHNRVQHRGDRGNKHSTARRAPRWSPGQVSSGQLRSGQGPLHHASPPDPRFTHAQVVLCPEAVAGRRAQLRSPEPPDVTVSPLLIGGAPGGEPIGAAVAVPPAVTVLVAELEARYAAAGGAS